MLKQKYFLADILILSAEKQPIKLSWRKIVWLHNIVYCFHVPLFFIVSGYFFKQRNIKEDCFNSAKRLLLPFYFVAFVSIIICTILPLLGYEYCVSLDRLVKGAILGDNYEQLWFLWALFWGKISYNILVQKIESIQERIIIIIAIGTIAFLLSKYMNEYYWKILPGLSIIPLIMVGDLLKPVLCKVANGKLTLKKDIILLVCFVLWIINIIIHPKLSIASMNFGWGYLLNLFFALCATICIVAISNIISKIKYLSTFLAFCGKCSILMMIWPTFEKMFIPFHLICDSLFIAAICKILWLAFGIFLSYKVPLLRKLFSLK